MIIYINNKEYVSEASTLAALALELQWPERGIAVAIDNKMVPRTEWTAKVLTEGSHVVIIKAACGG